MEPSDFETMRPHLERAVDDIDYFLDADDKRENAREEAGKRYDLVDELFEGWTPPARGKQRLTKTQYNALVHWTTIYGNPLTDEKREAILADLDLNRVELPTSDAGREAFAFWARGGWQESSRKAAVPLRKAGKTDAADEIVALSGLPDRPSDATELPAYREGVRTAAEQVRTILTTCLEEQSPAAPEPQPHPPEARYQYRRDGANFSVVYGNEQGSIPQSYIGAWYIYWLLQAPNEKFSATDLRQRLALQSMTSSSIVSADGLEVHEQPTGETVEDTAEEIDFLQRGAADLVKLIRQARASKDQGKVNRLMEDLQAVKDKIKAMQASDDSPRKITANADRKSATTAIGLIRQKCYTVWDMRQLATPLECIDTGDKIAYYPPAPAPDWNF